jgi:hypothetical protein
MLPKVNLYSGKKNLEVLAGPAAKASAQVAQFFKDKKVNDTLVDVGSIGASMTTPRARPRSERLAS